MHIPLEEKHLAIQRRIQESRTKKQVKRIIADMVVPFTPSIMLRQGMRVQRLMVAFMAPTSCHYNTKIIISDT